MSGGRLSRFHIFAKYIRNLSNPHGIRPPQTRKGNIKTRKESYVFETPIPFLLLYPA